MKIKMGQSHFLELEKNFGEPNEVITETNKNKFWVYKGYVFQSFSERVRFEIDPETGIVIGAVWSPDDTTGYLTEKELVDAVKLGKFKCELSRPPADHHYTPTDGSCYNPNAGITYIFLGKGHGVFAVGFSAPQEVRTPAEIRKK